MECDNITQHLNVLYVEDEENIRQMMGQILADEFASFDTAANGVEGLKNFKEKKYDLVITDIEMPYMGGLELAHQIRQIKEDIPIVLLTAYSEKEKLFKAIDIGVTKYLVKPFTPDKLLEIICEIFAKRLKKDEVVFLRRNIVYYKEKAQILKDDHFIQLTKKEKKFLDLLLANRQRVVSFEEIERSVWSDGDFSDNALRTLVKRLRKKLTKDLIRNYSGLGYKINLDNS